jgi:hypothetical protein
MELGITQILHQQQISRYYALFDVEIHSIHLLNNNLSMWYYHIHVLHNNVTKMQNHNLTCC